MIKTKIIATIGPACDSQQMIERMIKASVSVFRFNTKHNTLKWHAHRIERVRQASRKLDIPVVIMIVLQGPELRIGAFKNGQIRLDKNEIIDFVNREKSSSKKNIVIEQLAAIKGLKPGSFIYLDDGFLEARVLEVSHQGRIVTAKIVEGGILKDNKGVNFPNTNLDLPSLVKKDLEFISMPARRDIDFFSYSFVRNREDILELRKIIKQQGLSAKIVAKIENRKSIDNFEEILKEADAIMIARGDLGIEISPEEVPFYQKMIIKRCREEAKPVIVATQMLESMTKKPRPTRAEVTDVANAVYDAADALMLSNETSIGRFPLKAIKMMKKIIEFTEKKRETPSIRFKPKSLSEMIAFSAHKIIEGQLFEEFLEKINITNFVVFTDTGTTVRFLSRLRPSIPILVITDDKWVRDQLCLSYGVIPFFHKFPKGSIRSTKYGLLHLKKKGVLQKGDRVITIYGKQWGVSGETNTIRVEEVG
ncbi:pyruvate kinase [Candidatus Microgenomates bacterium]|nr:pyruvate kinase [Candidatus Microgenomates bacterium]